MATDSPFLTYKIECPICKTVNEFVSVRVGAYTEDGRDSDFCPRNTKWRFPRYQGYNPLLFFTATCSNCHYTRELSSRFREWKSDNNFKTYRLKTIKQQHLEQLSSADSMIKRLASAIDTARYPNESAIVKLLLAVYDEQLAERPHALDLGRFYLRIGWTFRDLQTGEDPGTQAGRGMISELEKRHAKVFTDLEALSESVEAYASGSEALLESPQLSADIKSSLLQHRDECTDLMAQLRDNVENCQSRMNRLQEILTAYRMILTGAGTEHEGSNFGKYQSFDMYLADLRPAWNGVVTNETEALQKAIVYYREAFHNGRDISPGNQQIQASYLIAELSRRVGDYETAREYFASTIKSGQQFIYQNRDDQSRTVLARKIMELAVEQGRANMEAAKAR